jgi:hypothetical protein
MIRVSISDFGRRISTSTLDRWMISFRRPTIEAAAFGIAGQVGPVTWSPDAVGLSVWVSRMLQVDRLRRVAPLLGWYP